MPSHAGSFPHRFSTCIMSIHLVRFLLDTILTVQLLVPFCKINGIRARVAKFGTRTGLRIQLPERDWGFESPLSHHLKVMGRI